ncbi:MgtC/SapB family protein [Candidatus Micrarchaeota archaeon]|nr:MgtC/SapB family protein [Candidatus Micrarchaeota archaeon]
MLEQFTQLFLAFFTWHGADVLVKLLAATLFGAIVGLDRRVKDAGPRTCALICLGATLFTVISVDVASKPDSDPGRVIAQIVTGIGFIGAGVIWREKGGVHGLTTAATIWAVAGVGVIVGLGMWETALYTTSIIFAVLALKRWIPWS